MYVNSSMRQRLLAVAIVTTSVVLTACGGDSVTSESSVAATTSVPPDTPTTAAPTTAAPTTPPPTTAPAPTAPTTEAPAPTTEAPAPTTEAPADDPACLVGSWRIAEDQLAAYYAAVADETGWPSIDVTGDAGLAFTADAFEYARAFELTLNSLDTSFVVTAGGTVGGSWSAADGAFDTSEIVEGRTLEITEAGVPIDDVGDLLIGIFLRMPLEDVPFHCDGPTIALPVGEFGETSFEVELTPA